VLSSSRPAPSTLEAVPKLVKDYDGLLALPLDERTAFVLSLVDDRSTVGELARETGWDRAEALAAIAHLVSMGALVLGPAGR
jgi:hypothetical protein